MEEWTELNKEDGFPSVKEFLAERRDNGEETRGLLLFVNDPQHLLPIGTNTILVGDVNDEGGVCDCCTQNHYVRAYKQLEIPTKAG
jgi:hypothetical protein